MDAPRLSSPRSSNGQDDNSRSGDESSDYEEDPFANMFSGALSSFSKVVELLQSLTAFLPKPDPDEVFNLNQEPTMDSHPMFKLRWCLHYLQNNTQHQSMQQINEILRQQVDDLSATDAVDESVFSWVHAFTNPSASMRKQGTPGRARRSSSNVAIRSASEVDLMRRLSSSLTVDSPLDTTDPIDPQETSTFLSTLRRRRKASMFNGEETVVMRSIDEQEDNVQSPMSVAMKQLATAPATINRSQSDLSSDVLRQVASSPNTPKLVTSSSDVAIKLPMARANSNASNTTLAKTWTARPLRLEGNTARVVRLQAAPHIVDHELTDECIAFLDRIHNWGLSIFNLDTISGGRPLLAMGMRALQERNLFVKLHIDQHTAARFFVGLENNYGRYPDIPYHNNLHGCDVLHSTLCLMNAPCMRATLTDHEVFAALIAAAGHDVNHPGVTNDFLRATSSPLAVLYNDQAVLENHHASVTFQIMEQEDCNIMASLDTDMRQALRASMIEMILATDMAKHFHVVSEFGRLVATHKAAPGQKLDLSKMSVADRQLLLSTIVHLADLAGPTKPWEISKTWSERIVNEFFLQGDRERDLQMPLGMMNDRNKIKLPHSQTGFIDAIVMPLWSSWGTLTNGDFDPEPLQNIVSNRERWQYEKDLLDNKPAIKPGSPASLRRSMRRASRRKSPRPPKEPVRNVFKPLKEEPSASSTQHDSHDEDPSARHDDHEPSPRSSFDQTPASSRPTSPKSIGNVVSIV
eukprot:TRINITY_DN11492_c6_g6_i4.p1 TRINITY_DN11492_c6_g6~~TRINITY_DN11492_c6_g6_i4.p1  ORF type:complete len:748 (+),score=176.75 TRINITY_DN11492_c6_g6_i4:75-2318(+)